MDSDQKLEQRVKTLEYELKILKNEIQRTLLDIQEQVLVHYYPDLRTNSDSDADAVSHSMATIQEKKGQLDATAQLRARAAAASEKANPQSAPIAAVPVAPTPTPPPPPVQQPMRVAQAVSAAAAGGDEATPAQMMALSDWVSDTVAHIGRGRTAQVVDAAGSMGWIAADAVPFLQRLADIGDETSVPASLPTNDILNAVVGLQSASGRDPDPEDALNLIDEAHLG
jgi:hypothetical protein